MEVAVMKLTALRRDGVAARGPLRSFVTDLVDRCSDVGAGRRARSAVQKIGSVGRAAERSKGGGVGRRPAPGDMSAAACPTGPIPRQRLQGGNTTTATGREQTNRSSASLKAHSAMGH
jgi:hypothetical protein